jgi:membrane-associated protein
LQGALVTFAFLNGLIDLLTGSLWTYPLLFGICAGDAVLPLLPSETAMIVCGIQAARGQLSLGWVIAVGAAGAFAGDNTSYALGRFVGQPVIERFFSGERARRRLDWARRFLEERGSYVLIVARFVPGGRTATTFTSGVVRLSWPMRFAPFILVAAVLWASYAALLGYLGGRVFRDQPVYALLVAFAIAALVYASAELIRWLRKRG